MSTSKPTGLPTGHSPLPWRMEHEETEAHSFSVWSVVHANDGYVVCDIDEPEGRLIVRAGNSHAALVSVAEAVAEHFADTDAPLGKQARAALAQAKGGAA